MSNNKILFQIIKLQINNFYGIIYFIISMKNMKGISNYTINTTGLENKIHSLKKQTTSIKRIEKLKKIFFYFVGISGPLLYVFYFVKSSGLLKSIEIDKKYLNRKKSLEEIHGVDTKINEEKLKEFELKWGINSALNKYEEKIKYGNKELNEREEVKIIQDELQNENVPSPQNDIVEIESKSETNPLLEESQVFFDSKFDKKKKL